ncbi:hypothetical protein PanWU01x14_137550, partial [Parasponia andersonii]
SPFFEYNPKMTTKTRSNGWIKKSTQAQNIPKMATFDLGSIGLRYIYLEFPLDEMNPTSLVRDQMAAGIVAGDENSETAPIAFSGETATGGYAGSSSKSTNYLGYQS